MNRRKLVTLGSALMAVVAAVVLVPTLAGGAKPTDTTPPVVTLTSPSNGSTTADTTPTFAGAAGAKKTDSTTVTVNVYAGSSATGSPIQTRTATRAGSAWSVDASPALAAGTYTARAQQSDNAGNVGLSSANSFTIGSPPPPSGDPVIAAGGDIACPAGSAVTSSACRQQATSNLLVGASLAGVLPLGDLQYDTGALADFNGSYDPSWGRVKPDTHPAVGNHEYGTSGAAGYFDYFDGVGNQTGPAGDRSKGYYSYDIGAWHLIALNSNCSNVSCAAGGAQETWLRSDLQAHSNPCTLAYWHHPRFSSGTTHGSSTATQALWQALYDNNADVVLSGHEHNYERFAPQTATGAADAARGIREFVAGTGGRSHYAFAPTPQPNSEVRNSDTFGVLELTLHASGYDWQFVPEAGKTFTDSGSGACH